MSNGSLCMVFSRLEKCPVLIFHLSIFGSRSSKKPHCWPDFRCLSEGISMCPSEPRSEYPSISTTDVGIPMSQREQTCLSMAEQSLKEKEHQRSVDVEQDRAPGTSFVRTGWLGSWLLRCMRCLSTAPSKMPVFWKEISLTDIPMGISRSQLRWLPAQGLGFSLPQTCAHCTEQGECKVLRSWLWLL